MCFCGVLSVFAGEKKKGESQSAKVSCAFLFFVCFFGNEFVFLLFFSTLSCSSFFFSLRLLHLFLF